MKPLLTTTALTAALLAGHGALAQATEPAPLFANAATPSDIHASDFIGMYVYAAEPDASGEWTMESSQGAQTDWENVGEINDLIITRDGEVASVLVDIGGFLGLGERQVAMNMSEIRFVADSETEAEDDFFLVVPATVADLEDAPAYDGVVADEAIDTTMEMPNEIMGEPLNADQVATLTTEDLTGARVYDVAGNWIGEIDQLNLTTDGMIEAAIVDVGGFLGLGEKPVEVSMEQLEILRDDEDDSLRVWLPMTEEELNNMQTWEG